jgi:probable rRNA maturation factor
MPVRVQAERGAGANAALRARLKRRAEAMLAFLQLSESELSLVLSGDSQIHQLNKMYRGKDRPTDVLAFPMREGDFGRLHAGLPARLLGDVVLSIPTAKRQARAASKGELAEMTMLVAHGLLHLLGWDHDTKAKERAMVAETEKLVAAAEEGESKSGSSERGKRNERRAGKSPAAKGVQKAQRSAR